MRLHTLVNLLGKMPNRFYTRAYQVALDAALSSLSVLAAFGLRFDGSIPQKYLPVMWFWACIMPVLRPAFLLGWKAYDRIWRYFGMSDAFVLAGGAAVPTAAALLVRIFIGSRFPDTMIPAGAALIEYGVYLGGAVGIRCLRRIMFEQFTRPADKQVRRTLLIGPESSLPSALRHISSCRDFQVVSLLCSDEHLDGLRIAGLTVGSPSLLRGLLQSGNIDLVLIADATQDALSQIVVAAMEYGVEARLLPTAKNVIDGNVRVSALPKAAAILPETSAEQDPGPSVRDALNGRVVMVTGAGGSIGSEICRQAARLGIRRLILLDHDENSIFEIHRELAEEHPLESIVPIVANIRDRQRLESIFAKYSPHVVLHAAAYKHVPVMELNCCEAVLNNVVGTRNIAELSMSCGVERFLMISTDKAVNPSSIMGATKRVAELLIQDLGAQPQGETKTRFACVRFGNVLGSRGSVVPIFMNQIAEGRALTITHSEMTRYFMSIPQAVNLVLKAATLGSDGEIYMLDMGDPVKVTQLAERLITMSGFRPGIDIPIRFVGSRPGEKLHEELWIDPTAVKQTCFPGILEASAMRAEDFDSSLSLLEAAALTRDDRRVISALASMPINFRAASLISQGEPEFRRSQRASGI